MTFPNGGKVKNGCCQKTPRGKKKKNGSRNRKKGEKEEPTGMAQCKGIAFSPGEDRQKGVKKLKGGENP